MATKTKKTETIEEVKETKTNKAKAKTIYETLESGKTSVTVKGEAIEVDLPESLKNVPDIDDLEALTAYILESEYALEFLNYGIKGALRYFRSDIKKDTVEKTIKAGKAWLPKKSRRVTSKVAKREALVVKLTDEGLTTEEILARLISEG